MSFLLIRNDIAKVTADAIVNPANEELLEGSGTSRAIFQAAGEKDLQEACKKIGHCDVGSAVITSAYRLNATYIIHAVGPYYQDGIESADRLLYSTYQSALQLALQNQCDSIAFPLLSSGYYGYPKDRAMKIAISAISDFLMEHEMQVFMVLYDRDSLTVSRKLFAAIEEYIDDNYVEDNDENYRGIERRSYSKQDALASERCMSVPKRSLNTLILHLDETFSEMLLRLIDERGLKDSQVYNKANIDRRHFSKIRNDKDYSPTKKTVISFAIALELSMDESIDLMNKAGFAFSKSSKFDVIISYFIENHQYNIYEINEVLFTYNQQVLGE